MKKCIKCGSHAFNLYAEEIDQGGFCDVHYWQGRAHRAEALLEQEPLEYWNAVEGWVKIDEVREHFGSVGCGTIYKTAGEDRVPVYTAPQQRERVLFPTMLRKMWSGGEVQAWLDENVNKEKIT